MPATPPARRPTARRPVSWRQGRALAAVLALLLLLTACSGDGDEEPPEEEATETTAAEAEEAEDAEEPEEDAEEAEEETEEEPPDEPVLIRVGQLPVGFLPYPLMEAIPETVAPNMGTWYEVEFQSLESADVGRSVASGIVDGSGMNTLTAGNLINQDVDLVITGSLNDDRSDRPGASWVVRSDAGITSAADMAGQTVGALGEGTYADVLSDKYFLEEGGLEPGTDYEKVNVPFPQMADALESGQIATGPVIPPWSLQLLGSGDFETLFTASDVLPGLVIVVTAFRQDFVDSNPEAVQKFQEDWIFANQWMIDPANRDQVIEIYAEWTGVPFEAYDPWILTDDDIYRPENGYLDQDKLQETWDFFFEEGVLEAEVDVQDHVIEELLPPQP